MCVAYIINRLPLARLNNVSPFEKLFHYPPPTHHLRAYGCLCFVSTLKQHRTKFQPRAHACIFIGYSCTQKGINCMI